MVENSNDCREVGDMFITARVQAMIRSLLSAETDCEEVEETIVRCGSIFYQHQSETFAL